MQLRLIQDSTAVATQVAERGANVLRAALSCQGEATLVAATGMSQLTMLGLLARSSGIDWSRVTVFHLSNTSACLPPTLPASGATCTSGFWTFCRANRRSSASQGTPQTWRPSSRV